jgi:hypothetical protein
MTSGAKRNRLISSHFGALIGCALAAAWLPACPHRPPEPPRPAPVVAGCRLGDPPPARPKALPVACPGYEACFSLAAAAELDRYLGDVDAWTQSAWIRCAAQSPAAATP